MWEIRVLVRYLFSEISTQRWYVLLPHIIKDLTQSYVRNSLHQHCVWVIKPPSRDVRPSSELITPLGAQYVWYFITLLSMSPSNGQQIIAFGNFQAVARWHHHNSAVNTGWGQHVCYCQWCFFILCTVSVYFVLLGGLARLPTSAKLCGREYIS